MKLFISIAFVLFLSVNAQAAEKARLSDVDLFIKIIICESGGNHRNVWGDSGKSFGICQMQKETFYELAKEAGFKGFKWEKAEDQMKILWWSIHHGKVKKWTCYKKVKENVTKGATIKTLK